MHAQKFTLIDHIFTTNLRRSQHIDACETSLFDFHQVIFNALLDVSKRWINKGRSRTLKSKVLNWFIGGWLSGSWSNMRPKLSYFARLTMMRTKTTLFQNKGYQVRFYFYWIKPVLKNSKLINTNRVIALRGTLLNFIFFKKTILSRTLWN